MNEDWVRIFAPATVANVGPGFDCFGFPLEAPGDVVAARVAAEPGVRITGITGDDGALPYDIERNTAGRAALSVWASMPASADRGLEIRIEKGLPPCSGMGSSAASAVAGAVAAATVAMAVAGVPYDRTRVLSAALDGEAVAAGARHADNVAPALLGGFTIARPGDPPSIARLEPRLPLWCAVVMPAFAVPTKVARDALPAHVPMADATANVAHAATLVVALLEGNADLLRAAFSDRLAEPYRARFIPGFAEAKSAALAAGAYGCSISGAGPSLFCLAGERETAAASAAQIAKVFADHGHAAETFLSPLSLQGARRL
ncbi:MAG: homoserine kinase [Candidatus Lernaella stagnicola]|nr:homoserine kinase [Candidatus Lernaella stagnicola]